MQLVSPCSLYLFQLALLSLLASASVAAPAGPPAPYHPGPAPHGHGGYKIPPRPFHYAYGVQVREVPEREEDDVLMRSHRYTMY